MVLARSIWKTGQDQCATMKRQLSAMLPGVSVFLDVHPVAYTSSRDCFPYCVSSQGIVALLSLLAALNARP